MVGQILARGRGLTLVHEPLNHEPTLSYDSIGPKTWYQFAGNDAEYAKLRAALQRYMIRDGLPVRAFGKLIRARTCRDILRVGKYVMRGIKPYFAPRRAVFKDPFMAFSAKPLQERDNLYVILTVRHPCGFVESVLRTADNAALEALFQPALSALLPGYEAEARHYIGTPELLVEQAALMWKAVYDFADRYLIDNPRTTVARQEDLVFDTGATLARMFKLIGVEQTPAVEAFVAESFQADHVDYDLANGPRGSYVRRDGPATIEKWRDRLSEDEVSRIMAITGEVAARYGYGAGPTEPLPTR